MPRDALDTHLGILCSEAERAVVALATITEAHPWLQGLGLDPLAFRDTLARLAAEAREAEGIRGMHELKLEAAQALGKELAHAYMASQRRTRELLQGLATVVGGPMAGLAMSHRRAYALHSPRLQGALDQARRIVRDLEGRAAALRGSTVGATLVGDAAAWEERLAAAYEERVCAEHDEREAAREVDARRTELLAALRRLRTVWASARTVSMDAFQPLIYEQALADAARRRARRVTGVDDSAPHPAASDGPESDASPMIP